VGAWMQERRGDVDRPPGIRTCIGMLYIRTVCHVLRDHPNLRIQSTRARDWSDGFPSTVDPQPRGCPFRTPKVSRSDVIAASPPHRELSGGSERDGFAPAGLYCRRSPRLKKLYRAPRPRRQFMPGARVTFP